MRCDLEMTCEFPDDMDLHSTRITQNSISVWSHTDDVEGRTSLTICMTHEEFDALVAHVDLYRKLKSQSEAA